MGFSFSVSLNMMSLGLVFIFFFAAHLFKFMRFWLVLMEERELSFFDVLFLYIRTTLVNLIIPFKLGELYRVAAVRHMTGSFKTGVLLVVIDRFFDTLALLTITLPFQLFYMKTADPVLTILFFALIILFICYLFYYPSYRYMNRYLIKQKSSGRALTLLHILDTTNEWYEFMQRLIRGRGPLMVLSSLLGWGMEFAALKAFSGVFGVEFDIGAFISYISSLLSGGSSFIGRSYNIMGTVIFAILTIVALSFSATRKKK